MVGSKSPRAPQQCVSPLKLSGSVQQHFRIVYRRISAPSTCPYNALLSPCSPISCCNNYQQIDLLTPFLACSLSPFNSGIPRSVVQCTPISQIPVQNYSCLMRLLLVKQTGWLILALQSEKQRVANRSAHDARPTVLPPPIISVRALHLWHDQPCTWQRSSLSVTLLAESQI